LGPKPSLDEIRVGLAGNLCRCTGYAAIYRSIAAASKGRPGKRRSRLAKPARPRRRAR
ncbi:MAG: 2Fe-2S iron-sulfur cluster-binding protein, partial [Vicinamibacterales bacterium]